MAYITDLADWIGSFIEGIDSLYMSITPPIMLLLGIITVTSLVTIFYMWVKRYTNEMYNG